VSRQTKPSYVNCPLCRKRVDAGLANRFRPFCSNRCRLIDLRAWTSLSFQLPLHEQTELERKL
jgi:endogenous inhibitor of DNA gyrase (YacG/DUF329 family)